MEHLIVQFIGGALIGQLPNTLCHFVGRATGGDDDAVMGPPRREVRARQILEVGAVMRHERALLTDGVGELSLVVLTEIPRLDGGRRAESPCAHKGGEQDIHVLISPHQSRGERIDACTHPLIVAGVKGSLLPGGPFYL